MSSTATGALRTKRKHARCGRERSHEGKHPSEPEWQIQELSTKNRQRHSNVTALA
jgi:hypothetical protein